MAEPLVRTSPTGVGMPARPQPVGVFPLPAGLLLIPAGPDTEAARTDLLHGHIPAEWPPALRAHQLAMSGDVAAALSTLVGDDPVTRYNRFVLDPDRDDADDLRHELGPEFGVLVDHVLFMLGRSDTPPGLAAVDGELAALILSAHASHAVSAGDRAEALSLLDAAGEIASGVIPPLAGLLLGAAADIRKDAEGAGPEVVATLERALKLLDGTDLKVARAELYLALGLAQHELADDRAVLLAEAVKSYHASLQLVRAADAPDVWAAAHANLATAYLTMPMVEASDQLRRGIAVQSLRSALTVYTPESHPERWSSAQLNLANALVYTPSKHQADNLVEAVELYEAVLAMRTRESDPLGRARVLANQGNALAHLGVFDHAKAKLYEARFIFEEFEDGDSVRAVRGVLDEIARQSVLARPAD